MARLSTQRLAALRRLAREPEGVRLFSLNQRTGRSLVRGGLATVDAANGDMTWEEYAARRWHITDAGRDAIRLQEEQFEKDAADAAS